MWLAWWSILSDLFLLSVCVVIGGGGGVLSLGKGSMLRYHLSWPHTRSPRRAGITVAHHDALRAIAVAVVEINDVYI